MTEGIKKILVMDDEDIVCDIAKQMLVYLGYEVETATDGEEAVEVYREHFKNQKPFHVVIMDLNVPEGMGGDKAVDKILEIDPNANMILSSGYANDPMMLKYREYGFHGAIAKPFDLDALKMAIESTL